MSENKNQWGNPPADFPGAPSGSDKSASSNLGGQNINRSTIPPSAGQAMPPPPPPEINIRTMKSDIESLRQTGGTGPTPKPFVPPELTREIPIPTPPPSRITPSDFTAPKPTVPQNTAAAKLKNVIEEEAPTAKTGAKKVVAVIGGLVLAIAAAVAGYLYVFPFLFPTQPPASPAAPAPPSTQEPRETSAPLVIPGPATPALTHKSLLQPTSPPSGAQFSTTLDLANFKSLLSEEAQKSSTIDTLTEIVFEDTNGQIPASTLMPVILPDFSSTVVANLFEKDYTIALYRDNNGVWPVYLLKLSAKSNPAEAQTEISKLETSTDLANLFLSDPGTPNSAGFKSGQASGLMTRYLTFAQKGAGLNIAWSKNTLILSTSYNGLKKAISSLTE